MKKGSKSVVKRKIVMFEDSLEACRRRQARGIDVEEDIKFIEERLKELKGR